MSYTTIEINYGNVEDAVVDLQRISEQFSKWQLNISFQESEGQLINELINLAANLQEYGDQLGTVIGETATFLYNARNMFDESESRIKKMFTLAERIINSADKVKASAESVFSTMESKSG